MRISTVTNQRFYYYLTGDERVGDLMHEQVNAVKILQAIVPIRKVNKSAPKSTENSDLATVSFGTDWEQLPAHGLPNGNGRRIKR